jgi:hypothetical protein
MERLRSIKRNTYSGVLFLQGVFKKDCKKMEDIFQDRLISDVTVITEQKIYDKIPVNFTKLNLWPKFTNLSCWFCSRFFKNRPWFEPQSIEPISDGTVGNILSNIQTNSGSYKKSVSIVTLGIFCTCNCVRSYIDLHTHDIAEKLNKISMLKFVYEIFKGVNIPDIQPSPAPTCMVQYGGSITNFEYQRIINNLNSAYIHELADNNFANICSVYLKKLNE